MTLSLAPMATLSHEALRRAIERFGGCDEYYTEMIHAPSLLNGGPFEKYYVQAGPVPDKIVWQLTSNTAEAFAPAARLVAKLGGRGVDLNMGCSAPQICRTGAGIAWMQKPPPELRAAVLPVRDALRQAEEETGRHLRLSVKFRLGAEDFSEQSLLGFTDTLAECGVEQLELHARTQKEKYRRPPRYQYAELLALRYPGIAVVLNGGIDCPDALENARAAAPHCVGAMVGRAAVQRPWVFARLCGVPVAPVDAQELALSFIDDVERFQPPQFYRTRLQRFFSFYCQNFSFAHYFATQMLNATGIDDSRDRVRDYFARQPGDRMLTPGA